MKILLSTFGTRGDVQPYVALGKGLQAAGHQVAVCTPEGFRGLVEAHGLTYAYVSNDFVALTEQALQAQSFGAQMAASRRFPAVIRAALEDEWRAAQSLQPDLIVYHTKSLGSYHIAEKLGVPQVLTLPLPATPTRAFPYPFFAGVRLGATFNRLTYQLMGHALAMWAGTTNDFRVKTLGLRPRSASADLTRLPDGRPMTVLYPYSPHLVPVPDDFPPNVHVTGYWFLDAEPGWQPSEALQRFLESGPPPVYIGFGSMGGMRPKQRTQAVLEALAATGQRGLLASGWGGLGAANLPENVHMLSAAPHDWLFPRMNAIVHHGGAGTTAAALRAGRPSVICPFLGDQPFWGWAVAQAGVGPEPIPQHRLTAKRLAGALTIAANDQGLRRRAERLGAQIRAEDGIANAIALLTAAASS